MTQLTSNSDYAEVLQVLANPMADPDDLATIVESFSALNAAVATHPPRRLRL
ncbi:MAG: hypothetical protein LBH11_06440 [Propionibacteriaceae bacterium]|jgi:hypothetical protein|nr:hypothetical protein [Propionibacteriaceae bacterium]